MAEQQKPASPPEDPGEDETGDGEAEKPKDPDIPKGLTKDEVFNAATNDALRYDWSCMKGPPSGNDMLPGIRYGASIEMRPLMMMLPCPCAGGVWSPPHADDGAVLDASGLWHMPTETAGHAVLGLPRPSLSIISNPPPIAPDIHPDDFPRGFWNKIGKRGGGAAAGHAKNVVAQPTAQIDTAIRPSSLFAESADAAHQMKVVPLHGTHQGQAVPLHGIHRGRSERGSFMLDMLTKTYYPGTEPYSIDFGCASPFTAKPNQKPGRRWTDTPSWTAIAVATPCPCAYGTFSTFKGPKAEHSPPTPDSVFVNPVLGGLNGQEAPLWQGNTSNYDMEANVGVVGVLLALVTAAVFSAPAALPQSQQLRPQSVHATRHNNRCQGVLRPESRSLGTFFL